LNTKLAQNCLYLFSYLLHNCSIFSAYRRLDWVSKRVVVRHL